MFLLDMATKSTTSPLNTPYYSTLEVQLARIALVMALVLQTLSFSSQSHQPTNKPANQINQPTRLVTKKMECCSKALFRIFVHKRARSHIQITTYTFSIPPICLCIVQCSFFYPNMPNFDILIGINK